MSEERDAPGPGPHQPSTALRSFFFGGVLSLPRGEPEVVATPTPPRQSASHDLVRCSSQLAANDRAVGGGFGHARCSRFGKVRCVVTESASRTPGLLLLDADAVEAGAGGDAIGVGENGGAGLAGDVAAQRGEGWRRAQTSGPLAPFCPDSATGGSFEQGNKSRLFKMFVPRQRVGYLPLTHHDEGDAVGQCPLLTTGEDGVHGREWP